MQTIKFCVVIAAIFCFSGLFLHAGDLKAPREAAGECGGCNGGTLALFETISTELCALQNNICCIGSCPARTYIHQADIPYVISQPGVYVVCENVSNTDAVLPAISIQSDGVTLDLAHNTISSELTYALEVNNVNRIFIFDGVLSTGAASCLRVNNVTQLFVSDIVVAQSPNNAFALNNLTQAVFDNCYFKNSFNVASGFASYVFLIEGSSRAISVSNSQIVGPAVHGFGVFGNNVGYGIIFKNCAVYDAQNLYTGDGFYAESCIDGLLFENCNVLNMSNYGFWVHTCSNVTFNHCTAGFCRIGAFFAENSTVVTFDACSVQAIGLGIILSTVNTVSILNSVLYGRGFIGFFLDGIRVNGSDNVYLYNNEVTNFDGAQYAVLSSTRVICESCTGAAIVGVEAFLLSNSTAVLKNCTGTRAGTGVLGSADDPNDIVIKDSLFAQNGTGINTLGTSFIILDTRSGTPLNINPDSLDGSVVITY